MTLPTYDKNKRKKSFETLPKGCYVVKIMNAKEINNKNNSGSLIAIAFDIAEGDYKDFYMQQFEANTSEDKKWPNDAIYRLTVPMEGSPQFVIDNWNTFFADLEDSNNGYVFNGELSRLKNKLIGGKFHIEQNEYKGNVYDHTRLRWTCIADDVRSGKAAKSMPKDKLIDTAAVRPGSVPESDFINIPDSVRGEEIPFD